MAFDYYANEKLIEKYPFLRVKDAFGQGNWSDCWLDDIEIGWRNAFGEQLCDELLEALTEEGNLDNFEFLQIKEKFGALRFYATGYGEKARNVLEKYEELSKYICGLCGKPAKFISTGWYFPFCEDCAKDKSKCVTVEEFYGFENYDAVSNEMNEIKENYQHEKYWKKIGD